MGCLRLEYLENPSPLRVLNGGKGLFEESGAGAYRFAYNGMEYDKEAKNDQNSYTTEFRQYDPRLGRWLSLDPLMSMFPSMSPYVAFDNNPIYYTDPYGLSAVGPGDNGTNKGGDISGDGNWEYHCDSEYSGLDGWVNRKTGDYPNFGQNLLRDAVGTLNQLNALGKKMKALDDKMKEDQMEFDIRMQEIENDSPVNTPEYGPLEFKDYTQTVNVNHTESKALSVAIPITATMSQMDGPVILVGDIIGGAVLTGAILYTAIAGEETVSVPIDVVVTRPLPRQQNQFYYVTYTKMNPTTGQIYVGRTSGYGSPQNIASIRDANHHMTAMGYTGPAIVSTSLPATITGGYATRALDPSYWAIRGSEQLQIDGYRKLGISGNSINGISPKNVNLGKYLDAARRLLNH